MYCDVSSYKKISPGLPLGFWWCGILSACQRETNIYIFFFLFLFFKIMFLKTTKCCYITVWVWCHCKSSELSCLDDGVCGLCGLLSAWYSSMKKCCLGVADVCCGGHGQFCFSNKWAVQTDNIARVITRRAPHRSTVPAVSLASALVSICPWLASAPG